MDIRVNNKTVAVPTDFTVSKLLEQIGYPKHVAVFINGKQLLLCEYDCCQLNENDSVRVIRALGGG